MSKISIVIITLNSKDFINSCLDSIFTQDHRDFEVIAIDNSSKDDTVGFIKDNYPEVILIENRENLGACKGRNQGIEVANGEWILSLDCDVILEKDFLNKIIGFAEESEGSTGIFQPKILKDDKKTIYSCGIYLSKLMRFYDIGKGKIDNGQFNNSKYIFGACSACALYKKEMLESIKEDTGYFDERFFFLFEDVDLCWRAQRKGWSTLYYPKAKCFHCGNSSNTNKKNRQYLSFRNRFYTIKKNEGVWKYARKVIPLLCYDFPRTVYLLLTNPYMFREI